MGYYTRFDMEVTPYPSEEIEKLMIKSLSEISEGYFEPNGDYHYDFLSDLLSESMKWYDWEKDMTALSKKYPDYLFELSGEGEESGDMWKCYFKNGKSQYCRARIEFDEFDENKLK